MSFSQASRADIAQTCNPPGNACECEPAQRLPLNLTGDGPGLRKEPLVEMGTESLGGMIVVHSNDLPTSLCTQLAKVQTAITHHINPWWNQPT